MPKSLLDRLKELDRGRDIDAAVDAADPGPKPKPKPKPEPIPKPKPKPKPKEKKSAGRDFEAENRAALNKQLRAKIAAARKAGNTDLVVKLQARLKESS